MDPIVCVIETPERNLSPRIQSMLAREALRRLLRRSFAISALPEIKYSHNGKPVFVSNREIHFSLSHCRSAVMAVVCDREVGCDIEDVVDYDIDDLLPLVFTSSEQAAIRNAACPAQMFTALWTAKEAYAKCSGDIPDDWRSVPSAATGLKTVIPDGCAYAYSYSVLDA